MCCELRYLYDLSCYTNHKTTQSLQQTPLLTSPTPLPVSQIQKIQHSTNKAWNKINVHPAIYKQNLLIMSITALPVLTDLTDSAIYECSVSASNGTIELKIITLLTNPLKMSKTWSITHCFKQFWEKNYWE